jgi:hypothetical protein
MNKGVEHAAAHVIFIKLKFHWKDELRVACSTHGRETRNAYKILARKPEGKKPLGRNRNRWEDNIRIFLREIGWKHGNEPSGSIKGG